MFRDMDDDYDRHVEAIRFLKEAESLFDICEFSSVEGPLLRALELDKGLGRAWELLGFYRTSNADLEGARECFLKAISSKGLQQDASTALEIMDGKKWPGEGSGKGTVQGILALGEAYLASARWRPALLCFLAAKPMMEPGWRMHSILGLIHRELGNLEPSLSEYELGISLEGSPLELHHDRAIVLMKLGRFDEAESAMRLLLEARGGPAQVWHNLGTILEAKGDDRGAMDAYNRALALDDSYYPSLYSKGRMLQRSGYMDKATDILKRALDIEGRVYDLSDVTGSERRSEEGGLHIKEIMKKREEEEL